MNANASKLITLSCPSCGAKLEITPNLDRFACAFCGQEHIVNRGGGIISLSPVVEAIHQVRTGVDKTASELAIKRLGEEIPSIMTKIAICKESVLERGMHYLFYADRSPLGRGLYEIAKARGIQINMKLTETKIERSMDWFGKSDTRLSTEEYDLLIQRVSDYDSNFPVSGLEELRNLEVSLKKKEEEIKKHHTIVDGV